MTAPLINFTLDPLGKLFATDGFRKVRAWDGIKSSDWNAGIGSPLGTMHCIPSGGGPIGGTLYAMYRFLDQFGQPSDLVFGDSTTNPIPISSGSGTITNVSNTSLMLVTTGAPHGLPDTTGNNTVSTWPVVTISGVQGNTAANGTWFVNTNVNYGSGVPTTSQFYIYSAPPFSLPVSNPAGNGTYTAGGTWAQGVGQIQYSGVGQDDSRAVTVQICRTKDGDASVFYVDLTVTPPTGGVSTNTDAQLGAAIPLFDLNNNDLAIARFGEPPNDKPVFAQVSGRFVAFGYPVWTQGKVAVTNGSTTVTGQNTGWTSDMKLIGRVFTAYGGGTTYTIANFNATTQTLTLSANYTGTTSISTAYAILPDSGAGRRTFDFSDPVYSAAFNPLDSLAVPEDPLAGNSVSLIVLDRIAYLVAEFRIWRLSFQQSPIIDGAQALGSQRGSLNPRCLVTVEDSAYAMDRQGIYMLQGGTVVPIDTPIHDLFDSQRPQEHQINFRWAKYFHAVHDPERETISWFVSMSGRYPRHAICYQYRFKRWWIEEFGFDVGSSALGRSGGRNVVFLGAEGRRIFASDSGFSDGVSNSGFTLRGNISTAGLTWFRSSGALFDSTWPQSCVSVDIVSGKGSGQRRRLTAIDDSDSAKFHISSPWSVLPDTTSVFQIGGVSWFFKSGRYRLADNADQASNRKIEAIFKPTVNQSFININIYYDQDTTPVVWQNNRPGADHNSVTITAGSPDIQIDTTEDKGRIQERITGQSETTAGGRAYAAVSLGGVTNGERHRLFQVSLKGLTP